MIKEKIYKCRSCKEDYEPLFYNGVKRSNFCLSCLSKKGKAKLKTIANKEKKVAKAKLKTHKDYQNELQPLINKIARLIDFEQPCIATNTTKGKMNGGHYISVGSNNSTRFNLHNIHMQSEHSNTHNHGDTYNYREGIKRVYGNSYMCLMDELPKVYKSIKLTKSELLECIKTAKKIIKEHENIKLSPEERIFLREKYNRMIGIYNVDTEFMYLENEFNNIP